MLCFPSKKLAADISLHIVCCWQLFCQKTVCRLKSASGKDKGGDKRGMKEIISLNIRLALSFQLARNGLTLFKVVIRSSVMTDSHPVMRQTWVLIAISFFCNS